jgi:hypothetical protein
MCFRLFEGRSGFAALALLLWPTLLWAGDNPAAGLVSGAVYTNQVDSKVPWSINIVKVPRSGGRYELHSVHAGGGVLGFTTLSSQTELIQPGEGKPVAAINGDFYTREKAYAGDPRGLQIVKGEVFRSPTGGVSLWVDVLGEPHLDHVTSLFKIIWPDGTSKPCGLNQERDPDGVVLFTPTLGDSTKTTSGRELILVKEGKSPWLPLKMGKTYTARVREIKDGGNTPLLPEEIVLSIGPEVVKDLPTIQAGAILKFATDSTPSLRGSKTALSGGPILIHEGKRQKIKPTSTGSFEFSSMLERHPRSAIGWNKDCYFLIVVDGRQKNLSVGMTLEELSACMLQLGCEEAMNLDGGGSATLWFGGKVVSSPCDGVERGIANSMVVVQKPPRVKAQAPTTANPTLQ